MSVEKKSFGKSHEGTEVNLFTIENSNGMKAEFTDYGAILVNLFVPDEDGKLEDVVLGYDTIEEYWNNPCYFGAVIGPNANRIADAKFDIDGVTYHLDVNDGKNNLHSHSDKGYHKMVWDSSVGDNYVTFFLSDEDGNMGFPGNKEMSITYTLRDDNSLELHYHGSSDKKTVLNPTNHTYFNLDGHASGSIENHELWIGASTYTPVIEGAIPTGEIATVMDTPLDFTTTKVIGNEIDVDFEQLNITGGYDHNWVVGGTGEILTHIVSVTGPESKRRMMVYTDLPGIQFYAGNAISPQKGKNNAFYEKRSGFCLETQYYPNSANQENFPSCIFGEEKEYDSITVYKFE